jgi:hypothetical protein
MKIRVKYAHRDEEEEEMEDDPEAVEEEPSQPKFAPTVQLKIGPDGTFQLDEKSLVIWV